MRIDYSLVRQILFAIEDENIIDKLDNKNQSFQLSDDKKYYSKTKEFNDEDIIGYHINYLVQAGLVIGINASSDSSGEFNIYLDNRPNLTKNGHDFLGSIRDKNVFNKTLNIISESGSSATIDIVQGLAKKVLMKTFGLN